MIQNHNAEKDKHGFTMAVNKFADMTNDEWRKIYTVPSMHKMIDQPSKTEVTDEKSVFDFNLDLELYSDDDITSNDGIYTIPSRVDWTAEGVVTPVRDQGQCGSCWAFSANAAIESAVAINYSVLSALSEQQLIDCSKSFGNLGCSGGLPEYSFTYAHNHSLCIDATYQYTAKEGKCLDYVCNTPFKTTGYQKVNPNSRFDLYSAIAQQPVSVLVNAGNTAWQFYSEGILKVGCSGEIDHAVTAVGYGFNRLYFIWKDNYLLLKNSWGTDWGMNGYIYLSSNQINGEGLCKSYVQNTYPTV